MGTQAMQWKHSRLNGFLSKSMELMPPAEMAEEALSGFYSSVSKARTENHWVPFSRAPRGLELQGGGYF